MDLSLRRKAVLELYRKLGRTLEALFIRRPFLRGSLYELRRQCGKPRCRCLRGEPHRVMVLSWTEGAKKRLRVVKPEEFRELRSLTTSYRRFRHARAGVGKLTKQILILADEIGEELLRRGRERRRKGGWSS